VKLHDRTSADAIAREATLRALYDLAVVASGVRDPAEIARMAVEHAQRLLHVDGAVVFVFDAVTGLLQPLHETASAVSEPPVIPGEGAIGLAFQKGEPVTIDDYRSWDQAIPESARRGIVSVLAVPLVADHPIGAEVGGVLGALFGVPIAAIANIVLGAAYRWHQGATPLTTSARGKIKADSLPRLGDEIGVVDRDGIVSDPVPREKGT